MDGTKIFITRKVTLRDPVLVVGLPGIGNVGKLVAEHLKKSFKAEKFATLYSPHFPHQVVMLKGGGIRLVGNRFYVLRGTKTKRDIVLLTGETQAVSPEGQYEVNAKIVRFIKEKLHCKFVYTLGGYSMAGSPPGTPKVLANVTHKELKEKFKDSGVVFGKSRGMIWGSAGMILAFAKMQKIDGICLMGETGMLDVDASAAKAVLKVLAKELEFEIDTHTLDKMIEETAKAIKDLEKQAQGMSPQIGGEGIGGPQQPSYIR